MADKEGIRFANFKIFVCLLFFVVFHGYDCNIRYFKNEPVRLVHEFDSSDVRTTIEHKFLSKRDDHKIRKRDTADSACKNQESKFLTDVLSTKIDENYTFVNETNTAMALAWAGTNDGVLIIVTSDGIMDSTTRSSVFRTTDYGLTYQNLTKDKGLTNIIRKHNGLQRNAHDPQKVYLIGEGMHMYITEDGGQSFSDISLPFLLNQELIFHSSPDHDSYLMAISTDKNLHVSQDNGKTWRQVNIGSKKVDKAAWGILDDNDKTHGDTAETIYFTYGGAFVNDPILQHFLGFVELSEYTLAKSTDGGKNVKEILQRVVSFERQGKFLYASQVTDKVDQSSWRHMMVSTDGGENFIETQLPTIESDRFYSLMDIEQDMIFMHVDNKDDTGHGTLYTSGSSGVVYSESLPKHLYPNYGEIHDFYKVKSMRGVYITSQMSDDDSIHTVISYDRGGEWQKIPAPEHVTCKDRTKECNLQLHGMYSIQRGIDSMLPISETTAVGLILAHGHVADALQKTDPDVYVSQNGGYSWNKTLDGPHHYAIGDHGGLIVAVSKSDPNPDTVKFSLDEGRCWHDYKFTNDTLKFTGLLTEPNGQSTVFLLWGYVEKTKKWQVHVIDFKKVIGRQCDDSDYEKWMAHSQLRRDESDDVRGCLLGVKEEFKILKKDSWCYNGYDHEVTKNKTVCNCTREDYECDYGFFRPGGSDECKKETEFKGPEIDICLHGHQEEIISLGYRKIPGDSCTGGYQPTAKKIDLKKQCDEFAKSVVELDEKDPNASAKTSENSTEAKFSHGMKLFAIVICIVVLGLASIMGIYFVRKFILLRRHKTEYRYSLLNQTEQHNLTGDDEDDADEPGNLERDLDQALSSTVKYHDSEDEELNTAVRPSTTRQNGVVKKSSEKKDTNPFGSYHDDSDDDMLS